MRTHSGEPFDGAQNAVQALMEHAVDGMEGADWDDFKINELIAGLCMRFLADLNKAVASYGKGTSDGMDE